MNIPYFLDTDFRRYGTGKREQPPWAAALVVKTTPAKAGVQWGWESVSGGLDTDPVSH
jgi:hypothetical protein